MKRAVAALVLTWGCTSIEFAQPRGHEIDHYANGTADPSAAPLASTMPTMGAVTPPPVPVASEAHLKNGVRVLLLEQHKLPLVTLAVVVQRGSAEAPPGLFDLFVEELTSGSDLIAPKALHANFYAYGVERYQRIRPEWSAVEVQFVAPLFDDVERMLVPTLATPAFDSDELEKLLDRHQRTARQSRGEPGAAAKRELYKLLFPAGHPYAADEADSDKPLEGVKLADVRALRDCVAADDVAIVVVGDTRMENVLPRLERSLQGIPPRARARKPLPPVSLQPAHVIAFDHPGDSQAQMALGFIGVAFDHPDFAPLYAASRMIQSGAYEALRLGHGLTYGVSGSIAMMRHDAPLVVTAAVDVDRVGNALRETFATISNFESRVKDEDQLRAMKRFLLASWPNSYDTVRDSASQLETIAGLDLPADAWLKLRQALEEMKGEDLARVAKTYLDPAHAQLVMLGDVKRFKADIDALGIGNVEVRKAPR